MIDAELTEVEKAALIVWQSEAVEGAHEIVEKALDDVRESPQYIAETFPNVGETPPRTLFLRTTINYIDERPNDVADNLEEFFENRKQTQFSIHVSEYPDEFVKQLIDEMKQLSPTVFAPIKAEIEFR